MNKALDFVRTHRHRWRWLWRWLSGRWSLLEPSRRGRHSYRPWSVTQRSQPRINGTKAVGGCRTRGESMEPKAGVIRGKPPPIPTLQGTKAFYLRIYLAGLNQPKTTFCAGTCSFSQFCNLYFFSVVIESKLNKKWLCTKIIHCLSVTVNALLTTNFHYLRSKERCKMWKLWKRAHPWLTPAG